MSDAASVRMEELLAHRQWVRALARRLAADESRADDLEQETWLAAVESPPRDARSVRGWLGTVVRNLHRNERRGDFRRNRREAALARPEAETPRDVVAEAETQTLLVHEVLALDEPYRETVLLRWFEDLTPTEVAARQGVPVETVKTRLKRAVARLRERMDERHDGDRRAWCVLLLGRDDGPGAAATAAAGGLVMGATMKLTIAAAAVLLLAGGAWWATSAASRPAATTPPETAAAPPTKRDRRVAKSEDAPPAEPTLDLSKADRDLDLHGEIVRADGSPVAGARVEAIDYPWRRTGTAIPAALFDGRPGPSTTSAEGGAFALRLRRGETTVLRVSAVGLATRESDPFQAGERARITMTPAVTLHVSVKDEAGAPVAGATLWVLAGFGRGVDAWMSARATTDVSGRCGFGGLIGGADVMVMPASGVGDFRPPPTKLPAQGEMSIDIVSPTGRTIRGRVFDAVTLAPIAGATIGVGPAALCATTSDGGGRFELRGWTGSSGRDVLVTAAGYPRTVVPVAAADSIDVPLSRGFAATGRVLDADGRPVAGAFVVVEGERSVLVGSSTVQAASSGRAVSDAAGRFLVAELDPETPCIVSAFGAGFGRVRRAAQWPLVGADPIDLGDVRLAAPRAVEGRVLTADGAPSPGATVRLVGPDLGNVPGIRSPGPASREERVTDDLGRFRFGGLSPGAYSVELQVQGNRPMTTNVKLTAERDVLDLVFQPPKLGGEPLVVVVKDDAGAPVAEMGVGAQGETGVVMQMKTDAAGRAAFDAAQGRITLVYVGGYSEGFLKVAPVAVEPGRREVAVTIERGVVTTCRVLDDAGAPLARATVVVEPAERAVVFSTPDADGAWTDGEGRIRVTLAKQGEFTFVCHGVIYDEKRRKVDSLLAAREEHVVAGPGEVTLRCRRVETGRAATVRVVRADGSPIPDAQVTITSPAAALRKAKTDAEGRARFDGLPAREFVAATAYHLGVAAAATAAFVPAGQEVELRQPPVVSVAVTVAWAGGGPVPEASVNVYDGDFMVYAASTGADGRVSIPVPAADGRSLRLVVAALDGKTQKSATRSVSSTDRDVRIELTR